MKRCIAIVVLVCLVVPAVCAAPPPKTVIVVQPNSPVEITAYTAHGCTPQWKKVKRIATPAASGVAETVPGGASI